MRTVERIYVGIGVCKCIYKDQIWYEAFYVERTPDRRENKREDYRVDDREQTPCKANRGSTRD